MAYDYCLLLTAKCDPNGVGEFEQGADAPKWVSPNDPEFTANDPNVLGPSLTPKAGDRVTFAVKIENLSGGDPNDREAPRKGVRPRSALNATDPIKLGELERTRELRIARPIPATA